MTGITAKRYVIWTIIGTGVSSVSTQILTIREFLGQFHGNEITISVVMSCWLLMTGMGSLLARFFTRVPLGLYAPLVWVFSLWPLLQLVAIRTLRETFFAHGTSPGPYALFLFVLATTFFYCLLTGFLLPMAQKALHTLGQAFSSGQLYVTDSMGDILGGALFSFVLVYWLTPLQTIAVTSLLLIVLTLWALGQGRRYVLLIGVGLVSAGFGLLCLNKTFEWDTLSRQYGAILAYEESPYGRIVVTREGTQKTFWKSGEPVHSDLDPMTNEEKVHFPLSQIERVKGVLLLSGGLGETLTEVMKHEPQRVDYVELDASLTRIAQEIGALPSVPSLHIIHTDARRYLKSTRQTYDAIIMDLPEPDTFQLNRFYTDEFFSLARAVLEPGGVLGFGMDYYPQYISDIRKKKLSTVYNAARRHFEHVLLLPAQKAHFLLSDRELTPDIPARLQKKGVSAPAIEGFFSGDVTRERILQIQEAIDPLAPVNTDFHPRILNTTFAEWFEKHQVNPVHLLLVFIVLTVGYVVLLKREEFVLFCTGAASMGAEMLVVFSFQVIYGYIYREIGVVITAFLLGLLPGAWLGERCLPGLGLRTKILLSETVLLCLLLLFFLWITFFPVHPPPYVFFLFCLLFSFLVGFQFPLVTRTLGEETSPAARCLAADLCGAAAGTILVGALIIPLWGLGTAALCLMGMKCLSLAVFMVRR